MYCRLLGSASAGIVGLELAKLRTERLRRQPRLRPAARIRRRLPLLPSRRSPNRGIKIVRHGLFVMRSSRANVKVKRT
jgi:hypothetical protein